MSRARLKGGARGHLAGSVCPAIARAVSFASLSMLVSVLSPSDALGQGFSTSTERAPSRQVEHPQKLCGEICNQNAACVDGRCVELCTPACREGTYCSASSECLPLPQVTREGDTEGELLLSKGQESLGSRHVALVDVGGALFLGVRPTYEWGVQHALLVRLQFMNTGASSYKVEIQSEHERLDWGIGTYFGYRRYETDFGNLRGFYWGGGGSYHAVSVRDTTSREVQTITHYAGIYGEFGYRWVFRDFLFGFGPSLGFRLPIAAHYLPLGPDSCTNGGDCSRDGRVSFDGAVSVEVGWFL